MLEIMRTEDFGADQIVVLRELFAVAWGDGDEAFTDDDWDHARGGVHFIEEEGSVPIAHASVVPRTLETGGAVTTPDDDGFVLVRLTPRTPHLDLAAAISCDMRAGDVW